ncbi:MAG: hypothetical protein ACYDAM_11200 [Leptospirales bacterium]
MPDEDNQVEYTITIEYEDFITRYDLNEVLSAIDLIIERNIFSALFYPPEYYQKKRFPFQYIVPFKFRKAEFSYLAIKSISPGSMILLVYLSVEAIKYISKRFKKGDQQSLIVEQIVRSGILIDYSLGSLLEEINNWAEEFVKKHLGKSKIKKITAKRKLKN